MKRDLDTILAHYIAAVVFTEAADDIDFELNRFSPAALEKSKADVNKFVADAGDLLTDDWSDDQVGHDIWLTRNGHGAGFWDRQLPNGDELSDIARAMGERSAVLGDDGMIYIE